MPPKKGIQRSTQVQARSEFQRRSRASRQRWWWGLRILWRCRIQNRVTLRLRHSRIRIQVLRTLLTHRTHMLLGGHRRTRASQPQGRGNLYQKIRLTKGARKLLFCLVLRMSSKLVDFLRDKEFLYKKHLKDYKDRSKREAVWGQFCEENNLDKDACQIWFQSKRTLFGKVTHMKSVLGEPQLTERQKWTRDSFDFLRDHILCHLKGKSEFRAQKGSASKASAAAGSSFRRETAHRTIPGYFSSRIHM